jgi:diacylglycerol kinase (ATP)
MAENLREVAGSEGEAPAQKFSVADRLRSFGFAGAGILLVLRSQHNARIHAVATLLVLALAVLFPLSGLDWCVLLIAIAIVWSAEAMNTALELLADAVSPDPHPLVGQAKDAAAGAVLIAAFAAAAVGFIILGPHCLVFLRGL